MVPQAAARVGFQKRLLYFLPDLSLLESLRGSSHIPSGKKKVNSLLGCLSDRGMDALRGQGRVVFLPALLPVLSLVAQHLPGLHCPSSVTTDGGTDITQGSRFRGFLQRAANRSSSHRRFYSCVDFSHLKFQRYSFCEGIPVLEAMEDPSVAQGELAAQAAHDEQLCLVICFLQCWL